MVSDFDIKEGFEIRGNNRTRFSLFIDPKNLNEEMSFTSIVGTICTLIGVYLVNRSLKKQKDPVEAISDADGM